MRPTHRLDLLLVPAPSERDAIADLRSVWSLLADRNVIDRTGAPGPRASWWVSGGFRRIRIDEPGHVTLYSNRQGGFSAHCPVDGAVITAGFVAAVTEARVTGDWSISCPGCGGRHALSDIVGRPRFALGRSALVTAASEQASLTSDAHRWATEQLGRIEVVVRRG